MPWKCPLKQVVGQIVPANQVPPVVHLTRTAAETKYPAQKGWVLEALDLQDLKEWPESEQKQARELLLKWEHLFAHSNLDLGKTALTKHKIMIDQIKCPLRSIIDAYPFICTMTCEGPYPRNVGYWCYPLITQSMGQHSSPSPEKGWWPEVLHRPQKA